ncbi:MAG: hypothetical protein KDJ97_19390 [Anaerolineae bacterium]|nr:hypothetical protein [Anaerolineae bacterium]
MNTHYNLKNIRILLIESFTDEDLRRLCYDIPNFRPVYVQLTRNTGKTEIIDRLIEYADRTLQIENLLALVKEHNPARYKKHQPYYDDPITRPSASSDVFREPQRVEPKKDKIWGIPQLWWVPIVVALIGLISVTIPLVINNEASTSQPFTYAVRVQKEGTNQNIPNSRVTIEVPGQAPLDEITDSNGFARIVINAAYTGQPGRLLIEANGYEPYRQEIDLTEGNLPDTIPLKQSP